MIVSNDEKFVSEWSRAAQDVSNSSDDDGVVKINMGKISTRLFFIK